MCTRRKDSEANKYQHYNPLASKQLDKYQHYKPLASKQLDKYQHYNPLASKQLDVCRGNKTNACIVVGKG